MTDWTMPPELDQPLPRRVKRNSAIRFIFFGTIFYVVFNILIGSFGLYAQYHKFDAIRINGQATSGVITGFHTDRGTQYADFEFYARRNQNDQIILYRSWSVVRAIDANDLKIGLLVPVLFDSKNLNSERPWLSSFLNINDRINSSDPDGEMRTMILMIILRVVGPMLI